MNRAHSERHASPGSIAPQTHAASGFTAVRATMLLSLLIVLIAFPAHAQYVIERAGTGGSALRFTSAREGFAFGENSVAHTADSGYTWKTVTSDIHAATGCDGAFDGQFVDSSTGWIIAQKVIASGTDSTFIYRTTDGGATWARQLASPISSTRYASHRFTTLHFADAAEGWVFGKGIIEHTTDGGATWATQLEWAERDGNNDYLNCCYFRNRTEAWAGGYGSIVVHTSNGGRTWVTQRTDSATSNGIIVHVDYYYLYALHFYDSLNGFAATNNGNYLTTHDGGASWTPGNTGFPNDNVGLFTCDENLVWQVGGDFCDNTGCYSGQSILYSTDGGGTWRSLVDTTLGFLGFYSQFRSIHFIDRRLGYTANERGEIFRIRDTSAMVAGVERDAVGGDTYAIYPNPARERFTIRFAESESPKRIVLYDIAGREVARRALGNVAVAEISTAGLQAGSYIIEAGSGATRVRRMVVVTR